MYGVCVLGVVIGMGAVALAVFVRRRALDETASISELDPLIGICVLCYV